MEAGKIYHSSEKYLRSEKMSSFLESSLLMSEVRRLMKLMFLSLLLLFSPLLLFSQLLLFPQLLMEGVETLTHQDMAGHHSPHGQ